MKIKLFLNYERWTFDDEGKIRAWDIELDRQITDTRILIPLGSCEVEVPDFAIPSENEIKGEVVGGLRELIKKEQTESFIKIKKLEDKINQLLCLDSKEPSP